MTMWMRCALCGLVLASPAAGIRGQQVAKAEPVAGADKQKKLRDDADKLVELAKQLKASVDKTGRDELSVSVVRQADAIEKMAKQVKERLK